MNAVKYLDCTLTLVDFEVRTAYVSLTWSLSLQPNIMNSDTLNCQENVSEAGPATAAEIGSITSAPCEFYKFPAFILDTCTLARK